MSTMIEDILSLFGPQSADPVQKRRLFGALNRMQPGGDTPGDLIQRSLLNDDAQTAQAAPMASPMSAGGPMPPQQPAVLSQAAPQQRSGVQEPAGRLPFSASRTFGQSLQDFGGALQGNDVPDRAEEAAKNNETFNFLMRKGLSQDDARAVVQNPDLMKQVLPALLAPKTQKIGPGEVLIDGRGNKIFDNSEASKPTTDISNYNFAKQQGYQGDFNSWKLEQSRAGATAINTDMRSESAEAKARGEGLGKRLNSIADDGVEARKDAMMFGRMLDLTKNVEPGAKTALLDEIRAMTGISLDPNTSNVQAFTALQSYLAPRMRVPGSGQSSDRDVAMFFRSLPTLMGTAEGNNIVNETFAGLIQSRAQAASIASQWQRGEITAAEADKQIASLPDPFEQFKRISGAKKTDAQNLPVLSPEEAAKLPPGTRFKSKDGRVLQVPGAR